jgi:hypothetical protein
LQQLYFGQSKLDKRAKPKSKSKEWLLWLICHKLENMKIDLEK